MVDKKISRVLKGLEKKQAQASDSNERLPYRLKDAFLNSTEFTLYKRLQELLEGRYVICPKVALNDLFNVLRPNENVHFYNNFFRKHVDFLLCEPEDLLPAFGVEVLKPISKKELRSSDRFMEELFLSVGLPLVQVPSAEDYELADLVNRFQWAVMKVDEGAQELVEMTDDSVPLCPECGLMMVLRMYRDGPDAGKKYYGCMNAPACDGVVAID
jgi:hypothetical protein